jgi:cobalt-zinc-cadmium efflux system outer membrane protein
MIRKPLRHYSRISSPALVGLILVLAATRLTGLDLNESVQMAWKNSSVLQADENLYRIGKMDVWRKYLPGEPQLQFNAGDNVSSLSLGASVNLPLPVKFFALGGLNEANVHQLKVEVSAKKFEIAGTVISAYLDCATRQKIIELQKSSIEDLETLYESVKKRYEDGYSSLSDSIGAELQLNDAKISLVEMEDDFRVSVDNFRKLLRIETDTNENFVLDDDIPAEILMEIGTDTADRLRALTGLEVSSNGIDSVLWQQLPDLGLSVTRNSYPYLPASPSGKPDSWSFSLGITLPVLFPIEEGVEAERAKNQYIVDQDAARQQLIQADNDIRQSVLDYRRNTNLLVLLREKEIPLVDMLVSTTLTDYKTGKVGFAELMQSRQSLIDIKTREIQLRSTIIQSHLKAIGEEKKHEK